MKILSSVIFIFLSIGCSLFSGGNANKDPGFTGTAAATGQPVPLPVEIADDIASISEAGLITTQELEAENKPESKEKAATESSNRTIAKKLPPKKIAKQLKEKRQTTRVASKVLGRKVFRRTASTGGKSVAYVVKPTDTLMKISFAHYGNVYRWREIYKTNQQKIVDYNQLVAGTVLTIDGVTYVKIDRNGKPYLIRWGDTLGKISQTVYGTKEFWSELWKNNRQLIRNPNKIYADFTLYYRDLNELRNPASRK